MSTIRDRDIFGYEKRIEELMQQLSDIPWFKKFVDNIPPEIIRDAFGNLSNQVGINKKNNHVIEITLKKPQEDEEGRWHYFMAEPYPGIGLLAGNITGVPYFSNVGAGMPQLTRAVIHYCMKGRCEIHTKNGMYAFMEPGVLCFEWHKIQEKSMEFYEGTYEGVEITFDLDMFSKEQAAYLKYLGIDIEYLREQYDQDAEFYIGNVSQPLRDTMAELNAALMEDDPDIVTLLLDVLRINNMVRTGHVKTIGSRFYLTMGQRKSCSEIHDHILSHMAEDIMVEQFTEKYNLSHVSLNKWFETMYGDTIHKYMRSCRMKYAARQIKTKDISIAEIAAAVGYDNQGKFSSAFKKYFGITPLEYRRRSV